MKAGKVLGVTCLVSAASCIAAWVYNEARIEKMDREFMEQLLTKPSRDTVKLTGQNEKFLKDSANAFADSVAHNMKRAAKKIK